MENEYVEEIIEPNEELLEVTDATGEISSESSDYSSNDISAEQPVEDIGDGKSLEQLLKEYFSSSSGSSEDLEEYGKNLREAAAESSSQEIIDYTEVLNDLYDMAAYNASLQETTISYIEEYEENNTLHSPINNVSLTNILIFNVGLCVLALAMFNFARRIF